MCKLLHLHIPCRAQFILHLLLFLVRFSVDSFLASQFFNS
jgi:hypothetical protein